ncbi:MAG: phage tail protein [Brevundimonas sp.]
MRGAVPGLESPVPVAGRLPVVLQEDEFLQRFVSAFDDLLAPVFLTLDSLPAYFDPQLAPPDFLEWLCGWVGIEPDDTWTVQRRREIVASAIEVHRWRGTARGVAHAVGLVVDGTVTVTDSGGAAWSPAPGADIPGDAEPWLRVVLHVPDPAAVDVRRVERVLAGVKAAHVPHVLEIQEVAS